MERDQASCGLAGRRHGRHHGDGDRLFVPGSRTEWVTTARDIVYIVPAIIGVVALLMATGYLLKLSFERGWISPVMRCTGGAVRGAVVGAIAVVLQSSEWPPAPTLRDDVREAARNISRELGASGWPVYAIDTAASA